MTTNAPSAGSEASVTAGLVDACLGAARGGLSAPAMHRTKLIALDTFGAMLAASDPHWRGTRLMLTHATAAEGADGPYPIVGSRVRTTRSVAALVNGYLAYALDIESHHGPAVMHAAAAVLPAALVMAQPPEDDGRDFLAATALGIEVACRVSLAVGPNDLYARGFHPSAVAGAFGAAAAGALLLRLDDGLGGALGLAATQASGLLAWASDHSEESRPFNPGIAARNGVTAACLAGQGFGAPRAIFDADAKYNVFRAWSLDGKGAPERLTTGFGERFAVEELTLKRHACCAFLHPALDGLLEMLANGLTADRIAALAMRFPTSGAPIIDANPLRSHRAQYILPVAAVRGNVRFEDVLHDRSDEPEIRRLTGVTRLIPDDDLDIDYPDRYTTVLEATTRDGATERRRVDWPRGCPQNPMTEDEIVAKFLDLSEKRVGRRTAEEIAGLTLELDRPGRLPRLIEHLAAE